MSAEWKYNLNYLAWENVRTSQISLTPPPNLNLVKMTDNEKWRAENSDQIRKYGLLGLRYREGDIKI